MDIRFEKREHLQEKPDQKNLGFGKHFTDYMFVMDWDKEQGWHDAAIVPYGGIPMDPATMVLHYAQETFEGLKAYRTAEGKIQLFRPEMNARRMIKSNERLCMPGVPEEMFVEAVKALVKAQEDWVPSEPGTSLYIRPFMFATEATLAYIWQNPTNSLSSPLRLEHTMQRASTRLRSWLRMNMFVQSKVAQDLQNAAVTMQVPSQAR